ncbi:uncharacterized protein HGUI_01255 [Hanseniaspora guilliermondii]|uniref:Zn(2)-C6 fungal-type domain-containing protein n=1 Tax=Hanseniaspora guilliermondii TaxID=56406 RepID=A0A1L0CW68_9ASCO|nr:uncharacterized protein HGUI_01255 [Hanseniaspora guilliermondii]
MSDKLDLKQVKIEQTSDDVSLSSEKITAKKVTKASTSKKNTSGHRPVTSCTHCRQHKIKCNALETLPQPCARCLKMNLVCEVNPDFKPQKGSQLTILKNDINDLKMKLNYLVRNEGIIANCIKVNKESDELLSKLKDIKYIPNLSSLNENVKNEELNISTKFDQLPVLLQKAISSSENYSINENKNVSTSINSPTESATGNPTSINNILSKIKSTTDSPSTSSSYSSNRNNNSKKSRSFTLGDVTLSLENATNLYDNFQKKFLSFFPIVKLTTSVKELYKQSPILFWTIMLTSSLSSTTPELYLALSELIKIKIMQKCWLDTPRSAYIIQALLILSCWPLPSQKMMDDCSYRFLGFAKNLAMQLGLHRGAFMWEFSRTQTMLNKDEQNNEQINDDEIKNDNELWRTRTWIAVFIQEQIWSSLLGLPNNTKVDFLVEKALNETDDEKLLPLRLKNLLILTNFQNKMQEQLASNVKSQDGLYEHEQRYPLIQSLIDELHLMKNSRNFENDKIMEIYYLYVKMTLLFYYFLPSNEKDDSNLNEELLTEKVTEAYLAGVKVVTLTTKLLQEDKYQLLELPIYIRNCITYTSLMLFKLYLTPLLKEAYVTSCRQSIVTVHRFFRNQYFAWTSVVENDISRLGNVLERLNFVLIAHPELFIQRINEKNSCNGLITKMRSHLSNTLFYDLVWYVHEARKRENDPNWKIQLNVESNETFEENRKKKLTPLPFYNQISKDDFETVTVTTDDGISVTTLVPTKKAIDRAKKEFKSLSIQQKKRQRQIMQQYGVIEEEEGNVSGGEDGPEGTAKKAKSLNAFENSSFMMSPAITKNSSFIKPSGNKIFTTNNMLSTENNEKNSLLKSNSFSSMNNAFTKIFDDNITTFEQTDDMLMINGIPLNMLNETGGLSTKETSETEIFALKEKNSLQKTKASGMDTNLFKSLMDPMMNNTKPNSLFSAIGEQTVLAKTSDIRSPSNKSNMKFANSPTSSIMGINRYVSYSPTNADPGLNLSVPPPSASSATNLAKQTVLEETPLTGAKQGLISETVPNGITTSNLSLGGGSPKQGTGNSLPSLKNVFGELSNTQKKARQQSGTSNQRNAKNELDNLLLQQYNEWMNENTNNNTDDILGWFDSNMNNEF